MNIISKLESHFKANLPSGYCHWLSKGNLDYRNQASYLWVFEAEWIPPSEIIGFDYGRDKMISGLIPFAFTGAGDLWCWDTNKTTGDNEYEVLFCHHDQDLGDIYAPNFSAWFYRNCLDYASGGFDNNSDSISEARQNLLNWRANLFEIYSGDWLQHLAKLAETEPFEYKHPKLRESVNLFGFITEMEVDDIIAQQFGSYYLNEKVEWGTFV